MCATFSCSCLPAKRSGNRLSFGQFRHGATCNLTDNSDEHGDGVRFVAVECRGAVVRRGIGLFALIIPLELNRKGG